MIQKYLCVWTLLFWGIQVMAQLSSPDEFLPHRIGETFPHHHQIIDYFEHVAANSSSVQLKQYGMTNEDRPLVVAYLSAPENMARLEQIRTNHLRKAKMIEGDADTDENIAVVWLSFGVHGNEAAASSTAPYVLHQLADPNNQAAQNWLKNTLVIIDPALNPDGYARYTQWYRQMAHRIVQPELNSREHREPWPGGRSNHYYFDLNRDWAWSTQLETKQRLAVYHQWLPHIHVDVHEQGINSPYYFAPAAKPYHAYITSWQRDFQKSIGENHARYFDEKGWLYFTKEIFDLLYPSYGDTYPMFNGAIGMTYEQGGSSRAGRAVLADTGDTLTLKDRIQHHTTTAISTVETASKYAEHLNRNFEQY
ncbi:MAG: M14 family zinc carboxypeptidase [Bacteroidota bacterium]